MSTNAPCDVSRPPQGEEEHQPLVSIVTPSLNQGEFIAQAIASVRNQTYANIEHIVIDAQSTDLTVEVLRRMAYPGLVWQSEPDEGQAHAIMKGFALARGEILTWLNADDVYLHSNVVERVINVFRVRGVDLVTGGGWYLSEQGEPVAPIRAPRRISERLLRRGDVILQPATFFRRSVAASTPLDCSLTYVFDWDFFIRAVQGHTVAIVPDSLAGYRRYGRNKTAAGGSRRTLEQAEMARRHLGDRSWEYAALRLAATADRAIDRLPALPSKVLRAGLYRGVLRAVHELSTRTAGRSSIW